MSRTVTEVERFTADPENMRLFQQERVILETTELISQLMDDKQVSKAELAMRLGKSKAYVTQLLDGRANMTLRTISDVMWALGSNLLLAAAPLSIHSAGAPGLEGPQSEWTGTWDVSDFSGAFVKTLASDAFLKALASFRDIVSRKAKPELRESEWLKALQWGKRTEGPGPEFLESRVEVSSPSPWMRQQEPEYMTAVV